METFQFIPTDGSHLNQGECSFYNRMVYPESKNQDQYERQIVDTLEGDEAFIIVDWTMKFIAMKFREKQAEWFPKREINWHVSSVVVRQEESLEVT